MEMQKAPDRGLSWEQPDSNQRPSACKADALNQLSYAPEAHLRQGYGERSGTYWIRTSDLMRVKHAL